MVGELNTYGTETPVLTDYATGVDDPGGTWSVANFTFTAIRTLLQANFTTLTASTSLAIAGNATLTAPSANILELANSTTAQTMRVFNTRTDASNGEWAALRFNSNVAEIYVGANGTGTFRNFSLRLQDQAAAPFVFSATSGQARLDMLRPSTGTGCSLIATNANLLINAPGTKAYIKIQDDFLNIVPKDDMAASSTYSIYLGNNEVNLGTLQIVGGYNTARNRAGMAFTLKGGQAAGAGNNNGGALNLYGGDKVNSGVEGAVNVALNAASLLGFHGATAVAQQATTGTTTGFTAGSGTAANDDSTFTGNSGTKAYTVGDIVLALKNYGLLAAS